MDAVNERLNLLLITADDLNADSAGWMGCKVGVTPNIDAFAATAHQFRHCHTVVPVCQPSRSAFLTGRVPHRNGAAGFGPVRGDVPTLTEVLRANGYFTAAINKIKHMAPPEKFPWHLTFEGSGKNPDVLRREVEKCLRAVQESGKPFFINANSTDPHGPFPSDAEISVNGANVELPSFLEDLPEVRAELTRYFSAVRRLDETVGAVLGALTASPYRDNTIVLFFADHGMSMPYAKATLYRNATWTPVLLRTTTDQQLVLSQDLLQNIDIMPTILDLLDVPKPAGMDGESWLSLLRGETDARRRYVITQLDRVKSGRSFASRCVRSKSRAYIWNAWADGKTEFRIGAMANRESWQAMIKAAENDAKIKVRVEHFLYRCPEEFYDEERDPDERDNLINASPYSNEIAEMKSLLLEQMERTGDPLTSQFRAVQQSKTSASFWRQLVKRS